MNRFITNTIFCFITLQMVDMIINIQDAFKELINGLDWMTEPTKKVAKEKVCFLLFFWSNSDGRLHALYEKGGV